MLRPTRPQFSRLLAIDADLRRSRHPQEPMPTARRLAEALELHPRTIQRDLDFLRYQLKAPLEYDRRNHGWRYADPGYRLPFFSLAEGELVALLAAALVKRFRGSPLEQLISQALKKVAELLPNQVALDLAAVQTALAAAPTPSPEVDPDCFLAVMQATGASRQIDMDYTSAHNGRRKWRRLDPYQIALVNDSWQLIGRCHTRNEVLMFNLERLHAVRVTDHPFARPADFSLEEYLRGAFRAVRGVAGATEQVRLRFTATAAPWVRAKRWHASQTAETLPDGGVRLCFEVTDLREVLRWALQWGADCEVEAPMKLRRLLAEEARRTALLYAPGRPPKPAGEGRAPKFENPSKSMSGPGRMKRQRK